MEDWDILTVSNIPSFLSELQEVRPIRAVSGIYKRFSAVYRHLSFRGITTCLRFSSCFTNHCLKGMNYHIYLIRPYLVKGQLAFAGRETY